ncbi:MAG: electron transport complex subunit RsxC [Zoogloeaceae bacterium]|jgi:electron transport complex protein RnfC|nr:electron transport complex subunit RsxC [Zoogloeaceae bacterium]
MLQTLFKFKGGLTLPHHKQESAGTPIVAAPLPEQLVIPLSQSMGSAATPVVAVGDKVLKGQLIGRAEGWISAAVHASTSGTVVALEPRPTPHPSGLSSLAVVIAPDGEDRWIERQRVDYQTLSPEAVRQCLQEAGVVGLGGAAFPSHAKIRAQHPVADLLINGAECEPYITCDDRLMRERADEIVAGIGVLRDLLEPERIKIGVEDNKPEAIAALRAAIAAAGESFTVIVMPTRYPAGSLKQLARVLTGKEIPVNKLPADLGLQSFNVATAQAIWRAIQHGEPVVRRVVTLTGNVEQPGNWEVPIGMPIRDLLALARPKDDTDGILMGGPMMGIPLPTLDAPIVKASNCLIARSPARFPAPSPEMPCIRCGACARACPQELQPYELYWWSRAKQFDKAEAYSLANCIECGCCAYVCPASIPLVQYFRFAKGEIRARDREQAAAEAARSRFEFRQFREAREKAEKAEKLAKAAAAQAEKAAAATKASAAENVPTNPEASTPANVVTTASASDLPDAQTAKQALIAAALERARAKKAGVGEGVASTTVANSTTDEAPATLETVATAAAPEGEGGA